MRNFTQELTVKLIVTFALLAAVFIVTVSLVVLSFSKDAIKEKSLGAVRRLGPEIVKYLENDRRPELEEILLDETFHSGVQVWIADGSGQLLWAPNPRMMEDQFRQNFADLQLTLQWAAPRPVGGGEMEPKINIKEIGDRGFKEGFGTYSPLGEERVIAFGVLEGENGTRWLVGVDEPVGLASSQYATVKRYIQWNSVLIALFLLFSTGVAVRWVIRPYYRQVEEMNAHLQEMNVRLEGANRQMERYTLNLTKLYDLTQDVFQTLKLEDRLQGILSGVQQVLGLDRILIFLPDEERQNLMVASALGEFIEVIEDVKIPLGTEGGILAAAFQEGEIITVDRQEEREALELAAPFADMDALNAIPCAVVPLRIKGQSIGILKVDSKFSGRAFTEGDLKLLEIYGGQAAAAVENARLYEQLRSLIDDLDQKVDELAILQQISNTMQSMVQEEQILPFILRGIQESLRFDRVALFLKKADATLEGKMGIGLTEGALEEIRLDPKAVRCLVTTVAENRKPMVVTAPEGEDFLTVASATAADDLKVMTSREMAGQAKGVMVATPMMTKEEVLGVIVADRYVSGEPVTMEHLKSLNTFANTAGLAVERAHLYQTLRSYIEKLKITDHLTGLATHSHFMEILGQAITKSRVARQPLSLGLLRVDSFREYNRLGGSYRGDKVLKTLAIIIREAVPEEAVASRWAGAAISISFPGLAASQAVEAIESIRELFLAHPFEKAGSMPGGKLTLSAGVTSLKTDDRGNEDIFSRVEDTLLMAEDEGGNRVTLDPTLTSPVK